jgi:anaerobic selenocysteine-containing dehydrogenase
MTNGWVDIKNTDMMLIMGGNPAECHPCGFKWAIEAKRNRNAKMIVVDPRFTRTASTADLFLQIRAGSDIAFLGGLIHYAIENNRIAKEYVTHYTNAAFIIKEGFRLPDDGLFSGFDPATQVYDRSTWNYQEGGDLSGVVTGAAQKGSHARESHPGIVPQGGSQGAAEKGLKGLGYQGQGPLGAKTSESAKPGANLPPNVAYDLTLQHPRCVFQLLKQQYSRYTPEMVERITGIPRISSSKPPNCLPLSEKMET